jgi:hypothetical protein
VNRRFTISEHILPSETILLPKSDELCTDPVTPHNKTVAACDAGPQHCTDSPLKGPLAIGQHWPSSG